MKYEKKLWIHNPYELLDNKLGIIPSTDMNMTNKINSISRLGIIIIIIILLIHLNLEMVFYLILFLIIVYIYINLNKKHMKKRAQRWSNEKYYEASNLNDDNPFMNKLPYSAPTQNKYLININRKTNKNYHHKNYHHKNYHHKNIHMKYHKPPTKKQSLFNDTGDIYGVACSQRRIYTIPKYEDQNMFAKWLYTIAPNKKQNTILNFKK